MPSAIQNLYDPFTGNRVPAVQSGDNAGNVFQSTPSAAGVMAVNTESINPIYTVAGALVLAATPTDVLTLTGSASKIVRLRKLTLYGLATAVGILDAALIRRSAANTGGTSAAQTAMKLDTVDAAASAVLTQYTANPGALGTAVGNIDVGKLNFSLAGAITPLVWDWTGVKAPTLRGVTDILALNFAGGALPLGVGFSYRISWEESAT